MHDMSNLKETLTKELELLAMDDKISLSSLEKIHKLTDTIKNLDKIEMLEEEGGYSQRSYARDGGSYEGGSYEGGSSYARRRRDSMGRYSRDGGYSGARGGRGGSRGGYSRAEGKEEMIEKIEEMMEEATTEKERQALQRCMSALENA